LKAMGPGERMSPEPVMIRELFENGMGKVIPLNDPNVYPA
jgi:hypothetical protein